MERRLQLRMDNRMYWLLSLLLLLFLMGLGLIVASVISAVSVLYKQGMLAMLMAQDIFAFILPAVGAMAFFYRRPLHVMRLDSAPSFKALVLVLVFYVVSLPTMNWIVDLNAHLTLPSWLSGVEQAMQTAEDMAAEATQQLLDVSTIGQLLPCVFVVGLMAGLSEEILFRGAMQRTMHGCLLNSHAAIWITAIVFSAIHLQFYGFVPRMLLGAWFGYLFVWTRSLWVPIIAHTLNNSTVVVLNYLANKGVVSEGLGENLGLPAEGAFPWLAVTSLVISIAIAIWAARSFKAEKEEISDSSNTDREATV